MKVFQIRQDDRFAWYETSKEHMEDMVNKCNWQGRVLELAKDDSAHQVQPLPKWIDDQKGSGPNTDALIEYIEQMRGDLPVHQPAPVADERAAYEAWMRKEYAEDAYSALAWAGWQARAALAAPVAAPVCSDCNGIGTWPDDSDCHSCDGSVHDLETQQYIGTRLRRVATAAGITVDYGDDEFYYAGAFSILGDIARALDKPAASVQPDDHNFQVASNFTNWLCEKGWMITPHTEEVDGPMAPSLNWQASIMAQFEQPDSGRDAALEEAAKICDGQKHGDSNAAGLCANLIRALAANVAQPVSDADKVRHDVANRLALWLSASMDQYLATDEMSKHIRAWLDHQTTNVAQVDGDQIITERDAFHDVADNLANAIAAYFGVDIGEHSSANCPWTEAVRVIEEAGQVGELSDAHPTADTYDTAKVCLNRIPQEDAFKSLGFKQISRDIKHAKLGPMGAVVVERWGRAGIILRVETSNGGQSIDYESTQ